MKQTRNGTLLILLLQLHLHLHAQISSRQQSGLNKEPRVTYLNIEIATDRNANGLVSQSWQKTFADLNLSVRIRRGFANEKPETTEFMQGTIRNVKVLGLIDRQGNLIFQDKIFKRGQEPQLKEYLNELKTYGAQGAPEGKPLWGLNEKQFEAIYNALSDKATQTEPGQSLREAIAGLQISETYPVRYPKETELWMRKAKTAESTVKQDLTGVSKGTALALLLSERGLGFHPQRTPEGALELVVDPLGVRKDVWPIGWDLKKPQHKTAPKLFQLIPVSLDELKLMDVINAISVKTGIPIFVDHYRIKEADIDINELVVSHKLRQTSWNLLLKRICNAHKLTRKLRIDERGQPFVWITTLRVR